MTADLAGSLSFETICVRENRLLQETRHVYVPRPNRNLTIERSHLTSKLMPGTEETWTLTVRGAETNDVRPGVELLAFLYDRSLDALDEFGPYTLCSPFAHDENPLTLTPNWGFANSMGIFHLWESVRSNVPRRYWEGFELWNTAPSAFFMRFRKSHMDYCMVASGDFGDGSDQKRVITLPGESSVLPEGRSAFRPLPQKVIGGEPPPVTMRKNLNDTAFFLPHLITDEKGSVTFSFKVPEALTGWKLMVLAHDAQLRAGVLMDTTKTRRRFVRLNRPGSG